MLYRDCCFVIEAPPPGSTSLLLCCVAIVLIRTRHCSSTRPLSSHWLNVLPLGTQPERGGIEGVLAGLRGRGGFRAATAPLQVGIPDGRGAVIFYAEQRGKRVGESSTCNVKYGVVHATHHDLTWCLCCAVLCCRAQHGGLCASFAATQRRIGRRTRFYLIRPQCQDCGSRGRRLP